jgi:hypothetical protein
LFASIASVAYLLPPTLLVFVPVVAFARTTGWSPKGRLSLLLGTILSPVAMAFVVITSWIGEGAQWSFRTHLDIVFTQNPTRIATLMALYAIGGTIVASALRAPRRRLDPVELPS